MKWNKYLKKKKNDENIPVWSKFWDFGEKSQKHQKNPKIFFTQNIYIF